MFLFFIALFLVILIQREKTPLLQAVGKTLTFQNKSGINWVRG